MPVPQLLAKVFLWEPRSATTQRFTHKLNIHSLSLSIALEQTVQIEFTYRVKNSVKTDGSNRVQIKFTHKS